VITTPILPRCGAVVAVVALVVVGLVALGGEVGATRSAAAAPAPGWCGGTDETVIDRPDTVGGQQIHVVYARAADVPDRFVQDAPKIVRDVAGVDAWWRRQDPTRTPRFDLASYLFCGAAFGNLDISSVQLPSPNAAYAALSDSDFVDRIGHELASAVLPVAGSTDSVVASQVANTKKYLVYLDAADPLVDKCGVTAGDATVGGPSWPSIVFLQPVSSDPSLTCDLGEFGTGTGFPAGTAAHELVHNFDQVTPVRPHACFVDPAHVCDSGFDLMYGKEPAATGINEDVLDAGHDDYYETPGPQFDVRTSPWLAHLDAPPVTLTVTAEPATSGSVHVSSTSLACTDRCTQAWDDGSPVSVWEQPAPGFAFSGWTGACAKDASICNADLHGDAALEAHFVPLLAVAVVVRGPGSVATARGDAEECSRRCTWRLPRGGRVVVVAQPRRHARFMGWQGRGCRSTRPTCVLVVDARSRPVAVFDAA
jgi:hypothetical protein